MRYILLILLFVTTLSFSQNREYIFDYLLEYDITFYESNKTIKHYYLTNSKDNSYLAQISEIDSLHYELIFSHHNKASARVKFLKSEFYNAEFLNIACEYLNIITKPYKLKDNVLETTSDTVINNLPYLLHQIELKNKPKKEKKKKGYVTEYYIINKATEFHLPFFKSPYGYVRWLKYGKMPNGIYTQQLQIDLFNQAHATETLQSYYKIDKKIVIVGECPESIKFGSRF